MGIFGLFILNEYADFGDGLAIRVLNPFFSLDVWGR